MKPVFTVTQSQVRLSAGVPIRAVEVRVSREVRPHDHDYCEICFVCQGTGLHSTRDYRRSLARGDIVISVPGEVHAIRPLRGMRVINVYYLSEWLLRDVEDFWDKGPAFNLFFAPALFRASSGAPIPHFRAPAPLAGACERELRDIMGEGLKDRVSAVFLRAAFAKFIILASSASPGGSAHARHALREETWHAIRQIESRLLEGRAFDGGALAGGQPIGTAHLSRIFRRQTGWTPSEYFLYRRSQRACNLLWDGRRSITEIACECGYSDASHFDRQFRRFFGLSPRAYRKLYGI